VNCLTDYIGLKGCGATGIAPSGLFINDLPGITLKSFASIAEAEQNGFTGVWNDVQERAIRKLQGDIRAKLSQKYKLNEIIDSVNLGKSVDSALTRPVFTSETYAGFIYETNEASDPDYIRSPLTAPFVQELWLYVDGDLAGSTTDVKVFDLDSGEELWTKNITLIAGYNVIKVNTTFNNAPYSASRRIFCAYTIATSTDPVNPYSSLINSNLNWVSCCGGRVMGATSGDITEGTGVTITEGTDSFGLSGIVGIRCGWNGLICNNKDIIATALWYACGIATMEEQILSNRVNTFTTTAIPRAKEALMYFEKEYLKEIQNACDSIDLDCDQCLECNEPYQNHEILR